MHWQKEIFDGRQKKKKNVHKRIFRKSVGDDSKLHLIIFIALDKKKGRSKKMCALNWSLSISKIKTRN
jgi:hypothetical protein